MFDYNCHEGSHDIRHIPEFHRALATQADAHHEPNGTCVSE